jgi:hypothetical protein
MNRTILRYNQVCTLIFTERETSQLIVIAHPGDPSQSRLQTLATQAKRKMDSMSEDGRLVDKRRRLSEPDRDEVFSLLSTIVSGSVTDKSV